MAAVERPFGFAVADDEDAGGGHCFGAGLGGGPGSDEGLRLIEHM